MSLEKLTIPLLNWYRNNARDLPWRHTDDPYRIWVSEIMLQQTRVAAVLGYYDRFLNMLPNVHALANAPEEQLLKLWEGLGYYSRVRNMQKAAKEIVDKYEGVFPENYEGLLELCGIGEYTAGAITSAAFGVRVPAVDGNVLRVMTRVTADERDITDAKVKKAIREKMFEMLPESSEDMRIFNQALMELGATVCVPNGAPKCMECPLNQFCCAYSNGATDQYPVKAPKKVRRIEEKTVFLMKRDGEIAIRKRDEQGLLAGLWEFPNVDGKIDENQVYEYLNSQGLVVTAWDKQLHAKHIFTHIEWHMTGFVVSVSGEGPSDYIWVDEKDFETYAFPSAFAKYVSEAKDIFKITEKKHES